MYPAFQLIVILTSRAACVLFDSKLICTALIQSENMYRTRRTPGAYNQSTKHELWPWQCICVRLLESGGKTTLLLGAEFLCIALRQAGENSGTCAQARLATCDVLSLVLKRYSTLYRFPVSVNLCLFCSLHAYTFYSTLYTSRQVGVFLRNQVR